MSLAFDRYGSGTHVTNRPRVVASNWSTASTSTTTRCRRNAAEERLERRVDGSGFGVVREEVGLHPRSCACRHSPTQRRSIRTDRVELAAVGVCQDYMRPPDGGAGRALQRWHSCLSGLARPDRLPRVPLVGMRWHASSRQDGETRPTKSLARSSTKSSMASCARPLARSGRVGVGRRRPRLKFRPHVFQET